MNIKQATRLIIEAIEEANECQRPYRCMWHNFHNHEVKFCPMSKDQKCKCHSHAKALQTLLNAADDRDRLRGILWNLREEIEQMEERDLVLNTDRSKRIDKLLASARLRRAPSCAKLPPRTDRKP